MIKKIGIVVLVALFAYGVLYSISRDECRHDLNPFDCDDFDTAHHKLLD